jgi:hypothetical protein
MILLDFSQTMIGSFMAMGKGSIVVEEDLLRHTVLNTIRQYKQTHRHVDHGGFVICCDSPKNWRKESFPEYKANRKKKRETDTTDWTSLFEFLHQMIDDLRKYFPYKVVKVEGAEADDCIAAIVEHVSITPNAFEKVLVLSGDKDFIQLQKHSFVKQYSPVLKKFVNGQDPHLYIKEHILKGDRSDGIPNFLSSDNTFVDELRQKPLAKKKLVTWVDLEPEDFCTEEMLRNYQRNKTLIDLDCIPSDLKATILEEFQKPPKGERSKLLNYFIKKRLKNLMNDIGDF